MFFCIRQPFKVRSKSGVEWVEEFRYSIKVQQFYLEWVLLLWRIRRDRGVGRVLLLHRYQDVWDRGANRNFHPSHSRGLLSFQTRNQSCLNIHLGMFPPLNIN